MPASLTWARANTGGNCASIGEVDAQGRVQGSSGCEQNVHNWPPRTLTAAQRKRFVAALDRLRGTSWANEVAGPAPMCHEGWSLRLVEANGRTRSWSFCDPPGTEKPPALPSEVREVLEALSDEA